MLRAIFQRHFEGSHDKVEELYEWASGDTKRLEQGTTDAMI